MKFFKNFSVVIFLHFASNTFSQKYTYKLNLNELNNDVLSVTLQIDSFPFKNEKVAFHLPKIVPGTYSIYDFGQYVKNLKAFDKNGNNLKVEHPDLNTWIIDQPEKIHKITYEVEDTWDAKNVTNVVFEPAGSNFEKSKNFVLNNHAIFGFFAGFEKYPYELIIEKPQGFYPSTGLENVKIYANKDTLYSSDYYELTDSPVMYCTPDTTWIDVANAKVLISVYHSENRDLSKSIGATIDKMLRAQAAYLGGKLPVNKYAFIIYLTDQLGASGGAGALEHSTSSFYYLPMMPQKQLNNFIVDVAAHEFFHILTPLTIHSYEIGNFDFIHPKMSKHLWLYEGITEYFAGHMQLYEHLIELEEYLKIVRSKMNAADQFDPSVSFTELSLHCLDKYEDQYLNVYQKGALIGLCLDILVRKESNGEKGWRDVMLELSRIYGKDRSFHDDSLFDIIEKITYPSVKQFLLKHVADTFKLPFREYLSWIGIEYHEKMIVKEVSLGGPGLGMDYSTGRLVVMDISNLNELGKKIKYRTGDVIVSINEQDITLENFRDVKDQLNKNAREGEKFTLVLERKGKKKIKKVPYVFTEVEKNHILMVDPRAAKESIKLRNQWMNAK